MDLPIDDPTAGPVEYADAVCHAMSEVDDEVVLVGHSLGGLVIPIVADATARQQGSCSSPPCCPRYRTGRDQRRTGPLRKTDFYDATSMNANGCLECRSEGAHQVVLPGLRCDHGPISGTPPASAGASAGYAGDRLDELA